MPSENLAYSNSSYSLIVQALCRDLIREGVNLNVSAADEMLMFFQYAQGHRLEQAVSIYLDSGRRIWSTLRQILSWRFGSPAWGGNLLDFASGYGRVTRHIVAEVPKERVWISDIYAEGVAFQEREFGVHGIVSTTVPDQFPCDVDFDGILVSSLFTHLPETRFLEWLHRLGSLLKPGGLLLFSVHDMSLYLRQGKPEPASGIAFEELSESGSLTTQEYGSAWVTEAYVRSAIQRTIGSFPVLRIPRGLASFQDLYVVVKDDILDPSSAFASLQIVREADGFLEHASLMGNRHLRLSGWVADRVTGQPPREVRVRVDGALAATVRELEPRPQIGQMFAHDPMVALGWQATVELPEDAEPESARLSVSPVSSAGEELGLYEGSVAWACLRSAQLDSVMLQDGLRQQQTQHEEELDRQRSAQAALEAQKGELARRISAMEASRFWKARNLWFKVKRAAGLTQER
jgi:SAM-dependent methyltransferase